MFKETKHPAWFTKKACSPDGTSITKSGLPNSRMGKLPSNFIGDMENRMSSAELEELKIPFDLREPSKLVGHLLEIAQVANDDIVLDFFAGSASTAHAVINANSSDTGQRRLVMVQMPETLDESNEAAKAGYGSIADLSKERIRRAGARIKADNATSAPNLDIGFRVLKIDTSNMRTCIMRPMRSNRPTCWRTVDNIKPDRTAEDLLFQVLVDWGVNLSLPIARETIAGKTYSSWTETRSSPASMPEITEDLVKELAKRKPLRAVFRDSGYR